MRRHVLVLTDSAFRTIKRALAYCIENAGSADYDGDHDERDVRSFEHASDAIRENKERDVTRDRAALVSLAEIAADQCSCPDRVGRSPEDHDAGCWYLIHKRDIDRARELVHLLAPEHDPPARATPPQPHRNPTP